MKRIIGATEGFIGSVIKQGESIWKRIFAGEAWELVYSIQAFALSLILGGVRFPLGTYPFGFAVLCAFRGGYNVAAAFSGVMLSTVFLQGTSINYVISYIAVFCVRIIICFFKGEFRVGPGMVKKLFCEKGHIRLILSVIGSAVSGLLMIIKSTSIYYGTFSALFGMAVTALVCASLIFFDDRTSSAKLRRVGLAVLLAGVTAGLGNIGLPFNTGAVAAFFLAVWIGSASPSFGCTVGLLCGLSAGGEYCCAFGISAVISSLISNYTKAGAVALAALGAAVLSLFSGGFDAVGDVMAEIVFSAAIAAPVMSLEWLNPERFSLLSETEKETFENDTELSPFERYGRIGQSFATLSKMLREISDKMRLPQKGEAYRICTAARARFCNGCVHEELCSGKDEPTVTSMFKNMAYRLSTNGRVSARIVPDSVASRCHNIDGIIDSVNSSARKAARLSGDARRIELFASDYSALAEILSNVSSDTDYERDREKEAELSDSLAGIGFEFASASVYGKRSRRIYLRGIDMKVCSAGGEDIRECAEKVVDSKLSDPEFSIEGRLVNAAMRSLPKFKIRAGRCALRSDRDNQCGDSVCFFENDEGYYYGLVSDGMGSGREAALTSGISCAFLEKLLSSGCPMRSTLELLNCFVRGSGSECFTTVDLMEADLYTGKARFVKSGAAPSFVIRKGNLYRLHSKTVPVGIMRALDAEAVSFDLCVGDIVIMMSDGVTGSYEDCPWLYSLLCEDLLEMDTPEKMSSCIAHAAARNTGKEDDITVCVMKVEAA